MADFYVSPQGNDAQSGRSADPTGAFRTLARAQQAMRASAGGDTAYVRAGTYVLDAPLTLTSADAGSTFAAYAGETPVLSGGAAVTNWQAGPDGVWTAQLAASEVQQLVVNGAAQTEARYPNYDPADPVRGGWLWAKPLPGGRTSTTEMAYDTGKLGAAQVAPGQRVNIFTELGYTFESPTIAFVDAGAGIIRFGQAVEWPIDAANRFYVSGGRPQLDQPGEWWFDKGSRTLSYKAPAGFNGTGAVVAGGDDTLVRIDGATSVALRGLTFANAATTAQTNDIDTAAVVISRSSGITLDANRFSNVAKGVLLDDESHHNTLSANDFTDIGASAIDLTPTSHENLITENIISRAGTQFRAAPAITLTETWGNTLSHNRIQDVPRNGISEINYTGALRSGGNLYQYNEIFRSGRQTADVQGIYILQGGDGAAAGSTIRYNRIVDTGGVDTMAGAFVPGNDYSWGITLDDYTSNTQIYGNLVSGTTNAAIILHGGGNNAVYNNIVLDAGKIGLQAQEIDRPMTGNDFYNNIVQVPRDERVVASDNRFVDPASFHDNIYYNPDGLTPEHDDFSYDTWRSLGGDRGSDVVASVGFVDAAAGNYNFAPNSFAASQGIQPLPLGAIGPARAQAAAQPAPAPVTAPATVVQGTANPDIVRAGAGPDRLIGGGGNDGFEFAGVSAPAETPDVVADLVIGTDHLRLSRLFFMADPGSADLRAGSLAGQGEHFVRNVTGEATRSQYAQLIYETDVGTLWWDADGAGGRSAQVVTNLLNAPQISEYDIFLV